MSTCYSCGSSVPEGQRFCSMCYGDPEYGRDDYYKDYLRQWMEEADHEEEARHAAEEEQDGLT